MGKEKEVWKKEVRGHPWDNQKSCHVKNSREPIKGLVFKSWLNLKNRDKNLKIEFNLNLLCSKRGSEVKASACNAGDLGSIPGPGRFPWRREWQPTPVFLPGEFHGQRSLVSYSPWGCIELDTTKLSTHIFPFSSNFAVLPCSPHLLILSTILWQWFSNYIGHIHKTTSSLGWVNFFPF